MTASRGFRGSAAAAGLMLCLLITALPASAAPPDLAGTGWELVRIQSMDDSVYTPQQPGRYTVDLLEDGRARVTAECARRTGSWSSPIVHMTRATAELSARPQTSRASTVVASLTFAPDPGSRTRERYELSMPRG